MKKLFLSIFICASLFTSCSDVLDKEPLDMYQTKPFGTMKP
ncbi:hypothetical protein [Parabacteroides faecalis]|nr:hypothetical protein [Parabacteroides faecalis]MDY6255774.1 hypothetical protein [Bacteroidales bacterium]